MMVVQMVGTGTGTAGCSSMQPPPIQRQEEEPLYVNAKQYHRILKRRAARAKLEADGRIPKQRRVQIDKYRFFLQLFLEIFTRITT
jgi:nuclear transcription factor Y alpha